MSRVKRKAAVWTGDQVDFLKQRYAELGPTTVAKRLGLERRQVQYKARTLGLLRFPNYTAVEIDFVRRHFGLIKTELIAERLDRTVESIENLAKRAGIKRCEVRDDSAKERARKMLLSGRFSIYEISRQIGRRPSFVVRVAQALQGRL